MYLKYIKVICKKKKHMLYKLWYLRRERERERGIKYIKQILKWYTKNKIKHFDWSILFFNMLKKGFC